MRHSNGPREGEFITIKSYKHDGSLHRTWRDTMVLKTSENALIGCNDHTLVTESDGRRWVTREPALMYFHKHYWFNIVTMIRDNGVSYYCNLASPVVLDKEALKYIDYDLDLRIFPSGDYKVLDKGEYKYHKRIMNYSDELDIVINNAMKDLIELYNNDYIVFDKKMNYQYYDEYNSVKSNN